VLAEGQFLKSAHRFNIQVKDICSSPGRHTSLLPTLNLR